MKPTKPIVMGTFFAVVLAIVIFGAACQEKRPTVPSTPLVIHEGKSMYSKTGHDITPLPSVRVEELAKTLTPEEKRILLDKGTERPFCGVLLDNKQEGIYVCRLCGLPLFSSNSKFKSGTGWPSFFQPFDRDHVREERDDSLGRERTETLCARCGSHLGHVFGDGPAPTGLRYCMNSGALRFYANDAELPTESRPVTTQQAP